MNPDPPSIPDARVETTRQSVTGPRLAVGFALVGVTSLAMCGLLLYLLGNVAQSVHAMRGDETSARQSLALAMAVREQYIHQAHTIIEGDGGHLDHYDDWLARVDAHAASLRASLPSSEGGKIDRVLAESHELDRLFRSEILPAVARGDHDALRALHRRAERLSADAVRDADALTAVAESRMASWHTSAISTTRIGLIAGASGMSAIVLLSVLFTVRIRRSVLQPLGALSDAARRFARGDHTGRIGRIGDGEFQAVADAYDQMLVELRAREMRLVQAERLAAIGQLAAGVAHEVNNPIAVIRGYLKTMTVDEPADVLRDELRILDDEAAACQRIAEDLLAFARAQDLALAPVEVDQLASEAARRFAESGEAGGRRVDVDVASGSVVGDGRRLRQVVLNLLRNAAEASSADAAIELSGRADADGGYELAVLDRGRGISEDDLPRIFEPFFSKREGGSGLGLAVCQGLVRAHGGEIDVEPRTGGGTVFRVRLPAEPPARAEEGA